MTQETIKTVLYLPGQLWYSLFLVNRDFSKKDFHLFKQWQKYLLRSICYFGDVAGKLFINVFYYTFQFQCFHTHMNLTRILFLNYNVLYNNFTMYKYYVVNSETEFLSLATLII